MVIGGKLFFQFIQLFIKNHLSAILHYNSNSAPVADKIEDLAKADIVSFPIVPKAEAFIGKSLFVQNFIQRFIYFLLCDRLFYILKGIYPEHVMEEFPVLGYKNNAHPRILFPDSGRHLHAIHPVKPYIHKKILPEHFLFSSGGLLSSAKRSS